ncbi:DUF721 domain-containing protein [Vaginella massiliensis]|uniref:DUF721 domain-containing protein n=1 Tax=Vaginella massiliensis TaxID=1816680 RepID=UPI0008392A0D|nr:DUF721 domain-containing protein [Vaginella massiliensis]
MKKFDKRSNEQTFSQALEHYIHQIGKQDLLLEVKAEMAWKKLMGSFFDRFTEKIEVRKGVLYIKMNSPAMRNELMYGKAKILENINEELNQEYLTDVKIY